MQRSLDGHAALITQGQWNARIHRILCAGWALGGLGVLLWEQTRHGVGLPWWIFLCIGVHLARVYYWDTQVRRLLHEVRDERGG